MEPTRESPRIGLALGSGSARGWAHIGVIRALEEAGVRPQIIAGSSIGALVGAAFVSGHLDTLEDWVCSLTWREILAIMDFTLVGGGLIQGERLMGFLREHLQDVGMDALPKCFGAVATDLDTGREVWLQSGSVLEAVRASIALPGLFTPAHVQGRWLVDGGLVNPVPVSLCRALGADILIAVNLNGDIVGRHGRRGRLPSRPRTGSRAWLETDAWSRISSQLQSNLRERKEALLIQLLGAERGAPGLFEAVAGSINIMQDRITRSRMAGEPPELTLSPHLAQLGLLEFDQAGAAIEEGRASVRRMLPALEQLLEDA